MVTETEIIDEYNAGKEYYESRYDVD